MSSRRAKTTEVSAAQAKGVTLNPVIVAYDGIAIIVNANSPVSTLTKRQVEQIFAGDITDWSAVGGTAGKLDLHPQHFVRHLLGFQGSRHEETRLRGFLPKDGG